MADFPDKVTLYDLEQRFNLQLTEDESFFLEWRQDLPGLSEAEQQRLTRVRAVVANLERRSVLENTVKLTVIAPLLDLSGLFLPPFYVSTEDSVEIEADFVFLKLLFQDVPRYAQSRQFVLRQNHELDRVLQILKRLAEIMS